LKLGVPFNLDVTLCCGQAFRWDKRGDWWFGVVGDQVVKVRQTAEALEFEGNVDDIFIRSYFSLDHDLQQISREIGRDAYVRAAMREFWGLRILRQPTWECLISFICATYKSVAAIRLMLNKLAVKFGEKVVFDGYDFYSFPSSEKLAAASLRDLESCGLGYRAKYVQETSRQIDVGGPDLEALRRLPYDQAKKELYKFAGVGSKVADCVLLFSMDKLEAFPVDVWVKRILLRHYAERLPDAVVKKLSSQKNFTNAEYEKLNRFGREYFGKYAGYAQEYLYHNERMSCHST
jgi:N-glycosylase/DNA lyase